MTGKATIWTGIIDLHQGDRGKIIFTRQGSAISGMMQVRRDDQLFKPNKIDGTWSGSEIQFTRYLNATTIQPFEGQADTEPNYAVLINGRFAHKLQGCWSALIHHPSNSPQKTEAPVVDLAVNNLRVFTVGELLRARAAADNGQKVISQTNIFFDGKMVTSEQGRSCEYVRKLEEPGRHCLQAEAVSMTGRRVRSEVVTIMVNPTKKAGPYITSQITPRAPTEQDKIEFAAEAIHLAGVSEISHHINGRRVSICQDSRCVVKKGPFHAGKITWRVSALSVDGGETYGHERQIVIARKAVGSCRIAGKAVGPACILAQEYRVLLYGPDNPLNFRDSTEFDSKGRFAFPNLPEGKYRLAVESETENSPAAINPSHLEIACTGAGINNIEIAFSK
ncbi:MAG: hypothetical protein ACK2U0_13125 [Candidatus Promineifilaceae bacterium]|jgi:hypothetical protein